MTEQSDANAVERAIAGDWYCVAGWHWLPPGEQRSINYELVAAGAWCERCLNLWKLGPKPDGDVHAFLKWRRFEGRD